MRARAPPRLQSRPAQHQAHRQTSWILRRRFCVRTRPGPRGAAGNTAYIGAKVGGSSERGLGGWFIGAWNKSQHHLLVTEGETTRSHRLFSVRGGVSCAAFLSDVDQLSGATSVSETYCALFVTRERSDRTAAAPLQDWSDSSQKGADFKVEFQKNHARQAPIIK